MRTTNNSLSTMSSQVTAFSPSTPAPTVNTPASPPSQPVSLPDTGALAQAISRALAESLPPLLSSLRDSSGGNSNMASTPVPHSSASTSTQSPASSSSGTTGCTSQSSGTLVVPSFISTYSSSGDPSVVSSLPATSSANLPVVVGALVVARPKLSPLRFQTSTKHLWWVLAMLQSPISLFLKLPQGFL